MILLLGQTMNTYLYQLEGFNFYRPIALEYWCIVAQLLEPSFYVYFLSFPPNLFPCFLFFLFKPFNQFISVVFHLLFPLHLPI